MMRSWLLVSVAMIIAVASFYYLNFGIGGHISDQTDTWAQFGDYFGGVLNPVLSFISIVLLVRSLNFQREANDSLINDSKRQEKFEKIRKLELMLYNSLETQSNMFDVFSITLNNVEYKSAKAVTKLENLIFDLLEHKYSKDDIKCVIEGIDEDDHIFSTVRRFSLILKLIQSYGNEQEISEYKAVLINFTNYKLLCLIAITTVYFDWDCVSDITKSRVLIDHGLDNYIKSLSNF
ncbi:hypothetical protein JD508_18815 [Aeromonas jandaei]|uniref:hypothetical protein n=1 Tax=Aeromonas jandaei TaxID=650 RepID=UPI00191D0128|nr:hypothetical protein [Aeromonas jandaei]MBL0612281.1 hypothetical protein [Aeromonas jandaei]